VVSYITLTWLKAKLQGEFGEDLLMEHGTHGMWDDVRASIARLVVAGPPVEGAAWLQDEEEIVEVLPPGQEEVCVPVCSRG